MRVLQTRFVILHLLVDSTADNYVSLHKKIMHKTINKIKNFYNSPIASNVIAGLIVPFVIFLSEYLYSFIKPQYAKFSLGSFADFTTNIDFSLLFLSLITLISVLFLAFLFIYSLKTFYKTIRRILSKKNKKQSSYPNLISSTANFSLRVAHSFPGTRGVRWIDNPIAIRKHLKKFFGEPLTYTSKNGSSEPIWWFRGGLNMPIDTFRVLSFNKYLIGLHEYKIKRIAVFHDGARDYADFIYVEVTGENPTGLYNRSEESFKKEIKNYGYVMEEYAVFRYWKFFSKKIPRTEYDDGATQIFGQIVSTSKSELRVRCLSKYNFIICAQGSPYNSCKFDMESDSYLDNILKGKIKPEVFFSWLQKFPKKYY